MINKNIIKNILFAFVFFSLILMVYFSGCISFCTLDSSEDKECISYSEAIALCEEISTMPKGYPICSDYSKSSLDKMYSNSCDKDYSENISNELEFDNLTLNTEQLSNQFRITNLNAWKTADKISLGYSEINKTCDSILNGDFVNYKKQIKKEAENMDYYNKQSIAIFLGLIYSTKKDLQDINIELLQDTLVYKDYIELNNILNDFQKALGNNLQVKNSLSNDAIYFYTNFYGNVESNNELSKAISSLSASDANTELNAEVVGWGSAIIGVIGLGLINPPAAFITSLTKGFNMSNSISSKLSEILENASQKTNLSEWNRLNILKEMLESFSKVHGKYSYSDKKFFELMKDIDLHISDIKRNDLSKQKELIKKIETARENLDKKIIEKSKYVILYEKYNIIESPYDLDTKLINLENNVQTLNLITLGELHHYLISYSLEYSDLEKQIYNYVNSDYESLISLCTADFMNIKSKVNSLPDSEDKTLLQNYIDLFFNTKDDAKKLIYCANVFENFSDANNFSCVSNLSNLINNSNMDFDISAINEKTCEQIIYSKIADAKNTEKYNIINEIYLQTNKELELLQKLAKFNSCLDTKKYVDLKQKYDSFISKTKYSNDFAINLLLNSNFANLFSDFAQYNTNLIATNNEGIKCYLESNYEYDLENDKLIFNNIFGQRELDLDLSIINYGLLNVVAENCLQSSKINSDKITMNFKCIDSKMTYKISIKNLDIKTTIQKLTIDSSTGYLETKVCIPNQSKTNYYVDLLVAEEKIISVIANKDSIQIPVEIIDNKLSVLFSSINNSEYCFNVNYILDSPVNTNIVLKDIDEDEKYYIYNYDLNIKNQLSLTIPKMKILLDLPLNYSAKNISLSASNSILDLTDKDLPYVTLNDVFGFANLYYAYSVKMNKDINLDSQMFALKEKIISLRQYSIVSESKIKELLSEYDSINDIFDTKTKLKSIQTLTIKVDKLLSEVKENYIYVNSYNLILTKIKNSINDYKQTISKLKNDFNISISDTLDYDLINSKISEAESLFSEGNVKEAIKTLNTIKINFKSVEDYIGNIFTNSTKKIKELQKQSNLLNANIDFSSVEKLGLDVSQKLSMGDYLEALNSISKYNANQKEIEKEINISLSSLKLNFKQIVDKYSKYKKSIDYLWSNYSLLDSQLNSEHYVSVKNFGIVFSFTNSSLNPIKTKITNITKDLIDLDKLCLVNDVLAVDQSKFDDFFYSFESIDNSLNLYQKEMKSKALNEITVAASKSTNEYDFYKAKDYYDSNNFVDAIYYAKLSQLNSNSTNSTNYSLYIGLGFILLLVILVLGFGKKLSFLNFAKNKSNSQQEKETYYSVEKED